MSPGISPELVSQVCGRLAKNQRVRRTLPDGGRLHIDRQLPFLCVYRQPPDSQDAGTRRLVRGEASYLVIPGSPHLHASFSSLVHGVAKTLAAEFGAFLIVEIWAGEDGGKANNPAIPSVAPEFRIHAPTNHALASSVEVLQKQLQRVKVLKQRVKADVVYDDKGYPPGAEPWLTAAQATDVNCSFIGITVPPVYRRPNSKKEFPLLVRSLRHSLSLALRHTYFDFVCSETTHRPPHFHSLGRSAVVRAVWKVDGQLAAVSNRFTYLQQLTPVNTKSAWRKFKRDGFDRIPEFHYRPLPIDPDLLKRTLFQIPMERIEDPALQHLFEEKRNELELKINMLRDRDTSRFLPESLQLFGGVDANLLKQAKGLLALSPPQIGRRKSAKPSVDAAAFAKRAEAEFAYYRERFPGFGATVEISDETNGLMVGKGKLFVTSDLSLARTRVDALLAHEVGTHLLTYYNGRAQPFQQLYAGLAGYEELQEGIAVLSEYLVGGLDHARVQQLAARVVAVQSMIDGASFIETFRLLVGDYGLAKRRAYGLVMRVYRGGGLTKDAVYLRGLNQLLRYLRKGGEFEPLLAGKIAVEYIPIIKELQYRSVLKPAPLVPRYLEDPEAIERLERLTRSNTSVADLICRPKTKA